MEEEQLEMTEQHGEMAPPPQNKFQLSDVLKLGKAALKAAK